MELINREKLILDMMDRGVDHIQTRDLMEISQVIAEQEAVNRWIPVSERLPENKTYVLTTIKVPNRIAHARSGWYEGGFFHNDNGDVWKATDMEVVAWMPLPTPYEPQERSDKE